MLPPPRKTRRKPMAYPEYTKCVSVEEYRRPSFEYWAWVALGFGAAGLAWPPLALVAVFSLITSLREYCDYVLERKLICLDGDRCALGTIVLFDPPSDSPFGPGLVDNDFGINLMLFPLRLDDFVKLPPSPDHLSKFELAQRSLQGKLVTPRPEEEEKFPEVAKNKGHPKRIPPIDDSLGVGHIEVLESDPNPTAEKIGGVDPKNTPGIIWIDVLHCEIEGARGYVMREAIDRIRSLGLGSGFCRIPILGWVVCAVTTVVLAPFIWAAVAAAWWLAEEGNPKQVILNPDDGELHPGDLVVIKGRWVQDADRGHGWNELHPVKAIQKIMPGPRLFPKREDDVETGSWARLFCEVPPDPNERPHGSVGMPEGAPVGGGAPVGSGSGSAKAPPKPAGMTPEQEKVYSAQAQPENGWIVHPALDGCTPNNRPR
jgi:hypothetical protein